MSKTTLLSLTRELSCTCDCPHFFFTANSDTTASYHMVSNHDCHFFPPHVVCPQFDFTCVPFRRRETNLQKGRQLLREGKLSEARECFNRCVNITPAMAHNLIKVGTLSSPSIRSPCKRDVWRAREARCAFTAMLLVITVTCCVNLFCDSVGV